MQDHIKRVDPNHPLLFIALKYLNGKSIDCPSSEQLCESLLALKCGQKYKESKKAAMLIGISDSTTTARVAKQVEDTSAIIV